MEKPLLITIPPSHYCEKARWALDLARVDYVEEGHAPIFHYAFVLPRTRSKTVPVLLRDGADPLTDSTDILRYVDTLLPPDERLYPHEHDREVSDLEESFDAELGVVTRRLVYCHVARSRPLFASAFGAGLRGVEKVVVRRGEAIMRALLGRAFKVSPRAEERMRKKLEGIFERVADKLGARDYLVGDRFTAADLTFVSLASPVLAPGRDLAPIDEAAPGFGELVRHFRALPAGRYAERVHVRHRPRDRAHPIAAA